ncbi:hypothetical protein GOA55_13815 [Sinorhizobium meliloti]|nr:hypothetical protein [Sinorhizobium meliloti]
MDIQQLKEVVDAQQKALQAIVLAITGTKDDSLMARSLIASLRDVANELPDGVAKDTIEQLRVPRHQHNPR